MKNIHVLPTDKPSRLHTYKGVLNLAEDEFVAPTIVKNDLINLNIYITSNHEIKEGDYCISHLNIIDEGKIHNSQTIFNPKTKEDLISLQSCKKIILTTDLSLNDVQVIDDKFLEWFVKNPNCEEVEIKTRYLHYYKTGEKLISFSKTPEFSSRNMQCIKIEPRYEIIIPQEESKQENCCTPESQIKRYVDCVGCDKKPNQTSKQITIEHLVKFNQILGKLNTTSSQDLIKVNAINQVNKISKKTAVEWLVEQYTQGNYTWEAYQQAKQMEKEHIIDAYLAGYSATENQGDSEQYYNETYKKDK